jgi:5-methyltetrahydrofolate--homocysteine methyltransferase
MTLLEDLKSALYEGAADGAAALTQRGLDEGMSAGMLLSNGLIAGMDRVGVDFRAGVLFVPEVLIAARAMKAAMGILRPLFAESGIEPVGRVVLGTVQGDLHDIGKNLVGMMLEGAGFEVHDLGVDVAPGEFVEAVRDRKPDLVGLSALLTTTMTMMQTTIDALTEAGIRDQCKVIVGGAPLTEDFAQGIGADAYGADASLAVVRAKELLGM